jgi:hypothetical protein
VWLRIGSSAGWPRNWAPSRAEVSQALNEVAAAIREETATAKLEMLKWSFVFWIGQVAAVSGLLAFMRH